MMQTTLPERLFAVGTKERKNVKINGGNPISTKLFLFVLDEIV